MKCAVEDGAVIRMRWCWWRRVFDCFVRFARYSDPTSWVWSPGRQSRSLKDFATFSGGFRVLIQD